MKQLLMIFLLSTLCMKVLAPNAVTFYIMTKEPIQYYEKLISAITWVESRDGLFTYDKRDHSVGWFHITPILVKDYNQRTHSSYTIKDCYDYDLSKKIFLYYANGDSYEIVARRWNGGLKGMYKNYTLGYWNAVKHRVFQSRFI
jgi:hypothetical protein